MNGNSRILSRIWRFLSFLRGRTFPPTHPFAAGASKRVSCWTRCPKRSTLYKKRSPTTGLRFLAGVTAFFRPPSLARSLAGWGPVQSCFDFAVPAKSTKGEQPTVPLWKPCNPDHPPLNHRSDESELHGACKRLFYKSNRNKKQGPIYPFFLMLKGCPGTCTEAIEAIALMIFGQLFST